MEASPRPFILELPLELLYNVVEHMDSLDDLGSLMLTNRLMADLGRGIRAKTLWRIAYRTGRADCERHDEEEDGMCYPCDCRVVKPALQEPESVYFKVRAWLYRRASKWSFGTSEEALDRCIISVENDMKNPYDPFRGGKLATLDGSFEDLDARVGEWDMVWLIFKRHLVMQRVQRVNLGDGTAGRYRRRVAEGWLDVSSIC